MTKLFYLFILFAISVNAQIVNLKITDFSDNLPLDDADIYFKNSTKNFVSDQQGKAIVDLNNVLQTDELIVSKKDYQDAILKVSDLKSELNIKLEKVSEVELKEAFVTNLKAEDILQKVIDNYDKNFNTEKYYFLANYTQEAIYDSTNIDLLNVDLQFKFKKDNFNVKSNNKVNQMIDSDFKNKRDTSVNQYLKSISIKNVLKLILENILKKEYTNQRVLISKYSDKIINEIILESENKNIRILIDKDSYAVVEFFSSSEEYQSKQGVYVRLTSLSYKYRLHKGYWVLKESEGYWNITFKNEEEKGVASDKTFKINVFDYDTKPFPEFNKSVNEKMDIRRSFK